MLKKYLTLTHFASILLFVGCRSNHESSDELAFYIDTSNYADFQELNAESVSFIFLDSTEFVGRIDKILHYPKGFLVVDKSQNKLFCYDLKGGLEYVVDNFGKGPGEYSDLNCVEVNLFNNTIEILDLEKRGLLIYSLDSGKFFSKVKLEFYSVHSFPIGEDLRFFNNQLIPNGKWENTDSYCIYLANKDTVSEKYFKHFWNENQNWAISRINHFRIDDEPSKMNYKPHYTTEIWELSSDGAALKYDFNFDAQTSRDIIEEYGSSSIANSEHMKNIFNNDVIHNLENFLESKGMFFFKFQKGTKRLLFIHKNSTSKVFQALRVDNVIFDVPISLNKGEFYSVFQKEQAEGLLRKTNDLTDFTVNSEFLEELKKLELNRTNSNPIVVSFEFDEL